MYKNFAPKLNGRYLTSNVNITVQDAHGNNVSVPVGGMYSAETTRGRRMRTNAGFRTLRQVQDTKVRPESLPSH